MIGGGTAHVPLEHREPVEKLQQLASVVHAAPSALHVPPPVETQCLVGGFVIGESSLQIAVCGFEDPPQQSRSVSHKFAVVSGGPGVSHAFSAKYARELPARSSCP